MVNERLEPTPASPARVWGAALVAGCVAGLVAWLAGEAVVDRFAPEGKPMNFYGTIVSQASLPSMRLAEVKNGMLAFAGLGGALGLVLGLAGGLASGRASRAALASIEGLVAGIGIAFAATWVGGLAYRGWFDAVADNLVLALLFHGLIWSSIGAAGGLAFGLGLGGRDRALRGLLGGFLGGWAGALLFEVVGTVAFPMDRTFLPVSLSWGSRLLGRLAVAACVAVGTALAIRGSRRVEATGSVADAAAPVGS